MYTSIDLFAGPGGLATGFMWSGIKPLIAVEMSYWTVQTYSASHDAEIFDLESFLSGTMENPEKFFRKSERTLLIYGDINKVSNDLISKILKQRFGVDSVDIVTGGAPCESFSMAGKREDGDERDDLFLNILRIARHVKSKMVLFENVKGLLSKRSNGKSVFKNICDEFESTAYDTSFCLASRDPHQILLTASHYGVPQNRERIFLVGINRNYNATFRYPLPTHGPNRMFPYVTVGDALLDLPEVRPGEEVTEYTFNLSDHTLSEQRRDFLLKMRGVTLSVPKHLAFHENSLTSHKAVNHREKMVKRMELIHQGENMKTAAERLISENREDLRRELFPNKLYGARNRRLREDTPSFTVTSHCLDEMIHPFQHRGLTPREAARLQSFPDWYIFEGPFVKFHSDPEQDRYEQIGDAIPPLLAYALGQEVVNTLNMIYNQMENNIEYIIC
ncbi:DNA cytosine methyltransferase [Anoxybacillus sp. ST4]|uniref:DNA cytosine methyltransferase n=1 Tax=Anoxybacillus sp. ST4 TaxID=2864181 RepID=UPI0021067EAF|nr:DNA cytosine methyltransferase [Anoxybacillus sp. ST4]